MAQEQKIIKGFNTEAGIGIYDYDSLANKPNIEGMIQDALEEFVPPVDNTLMNDGQAADAKVTGEAISRLESKIGSDSVSEQIGQAEQRVSERIEQAIDAIPPNQPLTFEGAVEATYNGSAPIAVTIPIIDNSLEVEGNAADAKATGEAIGAVLKKMDEEIGKATDEVLKQVDEATDEVLKQLDEEIGKATNAVLKKMDEEIGEATKTYVDEKFDSIEIPEIPEIPEFNGFIAQSEPPEQYNVLWIDTDEDSINEIENIDLSNYYTKAEIDYKFEQLINQYLKS